MSDTPETDKQWAEFLNKLEKPIDVFVDFARKLERERNEAREDAKRATYDATHETIKVSTVKSHWIEACRERDEAREKAERYRLEANAMMAQRNEAQRQAAELQACLDEIEEYGTEEINVAINLRQQLASALCERDEIAALVRRLFQLLETVEVSDSEREFYPTRIQSCRVMHTIELGELLPKLKEAAK